MKFIQKTILILSLVLIPTFFINAQSEVIDLGDGFTATIEETTEDLFEAEDIFIESGLEEDVEQLIYISDIRAELENYEPGDMVQGQFVINNTTESPVLNVYYDIELETEGPIVLDPRSSKDIFFSYKLPVDESISDINISLALEDGTIISSGVLDFNASKELNDQSTGYAKYGLFLVIFLGLILLIIKFKRKSNMVVSMILFGVGLFLTVGGSTANAGVNSNGTYTLSSSEKAIVDNPPSLPNRIGSLPSFEQYNRYIYAYSFIEDMSTIYATSVILQVSNRNLVPIKYNNRRVFSGAEKNYEVWAVDKRVNQVVVFNLDIDDVPSDQHSKNGKEFFGAHPHKRYNISTPPPDLCRNIRGTQSVVPYRYARDASGNCIKTVTFVTDLCRNIGGTQTSVPSGYTRDASGNCNQTVTDVCRNIGGTQTSVPYGYTRDASGNCSQVDVCSNISGTQTSVPTGYVLNGNQCVLDSNCDDSHTENELFCDNGIEKKWNCSPIDLCPNIRGNQLAIPANYTKNSTTGNCDYSPVDLCTNIGRVQTSVPSGYTRSSSGICSVSSTGGGGGSTSSADRCANLPGVQTTIPPYYFKKGSECTPYGQIDVKSIDTSGWNESCTVKISCSYDSPKNPHTAWSLKIDSGTEININECKGKAVAAVNRGDTCGAPVSYIDWFDNSSLPKSWWVH